jgi:hypothetical protein
MIYKAFGDEAEKQIKTLQALYNKSTSEAQKKLIQSDLKKLQNGYLSEKENAYYLDFHLGDSKNHILLHDIRLSYRGRTAQIDHLLINRMGITLLESKSFTGELFIKKDGSLLVKYKTNTQTFPNPIEQNERHKLVLAELINDNFDLPINTEIGGGINIFTKVLINPKTTLKNNKLPDGYERADSFVTALLEEISQMGVLTILKTAATMLKIKKVKELAEFILKHHKPIEFDYTKKYKISHSKTSNTYVQDKKIQYGKTESTHSSLYKCSKCNSNAIEIAYGKYGYYFKCLDCGGNTAIKLSCKYPSCKPKLSKRKLQFFKICSTCQSEEFFFTNKD